MPEPAHGSAAAPVGRGGAQSFWIGASIGFVPWALVVAVGMLGLSFDGLALVLPGTSFLVGVAVVWPARTRVLGAGLLTGSLLAGALTPVVAIGWWLATAGS